MRRGLWGGDIPNTRLRPLQLLQQTLGVGEEIIHETDREFGVIGRERAPGQRNDGCDVRVSETLGEDFVADEAGTAGEDYLHYESVTLESLRVWHSLMIWCLLL